MKYDDFVKQKIKTDIDSGFNVYDCDLNKKLFDFQKAIVKWACKRGRAAIFADTGLGKTIMQIDWARLVSQHTKKPVLIIAPLCVSHQTVREGIKFGVKIKYVRDKSECADKINITNYEMIDHFDLSNFSGIVLDESSVLKHSNSKTRQKIINLCEKIPYKLSCTATPSPNDFMELGAQSEFLGIMTTLEMLSTYFIHDSGETSVWRLKKYGTSEFWKWLSKWSIFISKPSDIGFKDDGFNLPNLNYSEHIVKTNKRLDGELFVKEANTLNERRSAKKLSINDRVYSVANIINNSDEQWIVWCNLNQESNMLSKYINDSKDIKGSDDVEYKEKQIMDFTNGKLKCLITKPTISGFGMNWQHCRNMAFVGLSDSWEQYYQAIRRCYRFGQKKEVNVHIISADIEGAVLKNIQKKESMNIELRQKMVHYTRDFTKKEVLGLKKDKNEYKTDLKENHEYKLYLGDSVLVSKKLKDDSIDYTIFSPPFAQLYMYSNSEYDMGNVRNHNQFHDQFKYLIKEMFRITKPGRLLSFHCMNLPTSKQHDGFIGVRDFRGDLIRNFTKENWIYHSEVCIWKDPVVSMQRTKAIGLLYKQLRKDSSISRQAIADYVVTMRKPGENQEKITKTKEGFTLPLWQKYASPIWTDIKQSKTLNYRVAKINEDEKHICPLQLDVIERCVNLWSNPRDLVFSPFAGIGSEGFVALKMNRRFIGIELKENYWNTAINNLEEAKKEQGILF